MKMKMKIGKIIRKHRVENNLTQSDLAIMVGKSPSYISRLELDKTEIEFSSIVNFAKALNLKVVDILMERIDLYERGNKKHKKELKEKLAKEAKIASDLFKVVVSLVSKPKRIKNL